MTILKLSFNNFQTKPKRLVSYVENNSIEINHHDKGIWELINYLDINTEKRGIKLEEGNVFRIGKQIIKMKVLITPEVYKKSVKRIKSLSKAKLESKKRATKFYSVKELNDNQIDSMTNDLESSDMYCRVCLEKETLDNRFHDFCGCRRKMPTHMKCLQMWLEKNAPVNESNGITFYNFHNVCCEICKAQFPSTYKNKNGKERPLIEPSIPKTSPYALLEIYQIENPKIIKALMLLDMSVERSLTIGRSSESDIIFKHHSISRKHCVFYMRKDGFYIFDDDSKFGTYVMLTKRKLKKKQNIILKIGNYLMEIHPFKKTPCDCIKIGDHINLIANPYVKDESTDDNYREVKTFNDMANMKKKSEKNLKCSLEDIVEEEEEEEDETKHRADSKILFEEDEFAFNSRDDIENSNLLDARPPRQSVSFRSVLMHNTLNKTDLKEELENNKEDFRSPQGKELDIEISRNLDNSNIYNFS